MECWNCGYLCDAGSTFCPKCGKNLYNIPSEPMPPYSGTLSFYSTGCMVNQQVSDALETYHLIAERYPETAELYRPVIDEIEKVKIATSEQDRKISELETTQKDFTDFKFALDKYIDLVNKYEEEPVYQEYLKDNPSLFNLQIVESYSKFRLAGELIPDFLLILHDITHLFVEIEKPSKSIFNEDGTESAEYRHSIQQVRDYVSWAQGELDFLRKRGCPNINQNNIQGLLVIGHSVDLTFEDIKRLERINYEYRGLYSVKTFDQLYHERIQDIRTLGFKFN